MKSLKPALSVCNAKYESILIYCKYKVRIGSRVKTGDGDLYLVTEVQYRKGAFPWLSGARVDNGKVVSGVQPICFSVTGEKNKHSIVTF